MMNIFLQTFLFFCFQERIPIQLGGPQNKSCPLPVGEK